MVHRPRAVGHRHQALARDSIHDRADHSSAAVGATPATDTASLDTLDPGLMPAPDAAVVTDHPAAPGSDQRAGRPQGPPSAVRLAAGLRELQLENVHPLRLRLLLEIERTGSISSAAEACSIAQPSASAHVRALETATGQRLVTRHGRGSRLTAAGKVVASHADRVLATLDNMRRALDAFDGRVGGELVLAATLTPSLHLLPSILRAYSERYPGVTVNLRTTTSQNVIQEVVRRGAEIGFAAEVPTGEPVVSRQILSDELVGIAAPGVVRFDDGGVTVGELARHTLLVGSESSSTRTVTERYLAGAGFRPTRVWVFDSYDAITRAVADGLGVSFTSRLLVRESVQRGELIAFRPLGLERMLRPIYALRSGVRELSPEGAAFMQFLATPPWSADEQAPPRAAGAKG
jgi:molybdate transport repressor ModE-like protein